MTLEELTRLLNQQSLQGFSGQSAPIGYDQIISAIQSQYQPASFAPVSTQSGAKRFITGQEFSQPSFVEYGRQLQDQPPLYVPQDFAEQQAALKAKEAENALTETGSSGVSSSYNPAVNESVGQAGLEALQSISHAGNVSGLLKMLGLENIFSKPVIGAAEAKAANDVMTAVGAYGGTTPGEASQIVGALQAMAPFGMLGKQDSVVAAKALGEAFDNNTQLMAGYFDAATNRDIGQIVDSLASNSETGLTPAQYGAIGASVGSDIHNEIANGMNYYDAVTKVANDLGVNTIGNYGQGSLPLTNPVETQYVQPVNVVSDPVPQLYVVGTDEFGNDVYSGGSGGGYSGSYGNGGWSGTSLSSFFGGTGGSGD